jgi:hypothetical protein
MATSPRPAPPSGSTPSPPPSSGSSRSPFMQLASMSSVASLLASLETLPDPATQDLLALGVADSPEALASALPPLHDAQRAVRHLTKSVALLSARNQLLAQAADDSAARIHASHERFLELGKVREELARRAKVLDAEIAVCDAQLKQGAKPSLQSNHRGTRPPPILVDSDEENLSPWDETPVHSPRSSLNSHLRKSPHHHVRSAAASVDYSSPRSSLGSIREDVLLAGLISSLDTNHGDDD